MLSELFENSWTRFRKNFWRQAVGRRNFDLHFCEISQDNSTMEEQTGTVFEVSRESQNFQNTVLFEPNTPKEGHESRFSEIIEPSDSPGGKNIEPCILGVTAGLRWKSVVLVSETMNPAPTSCAKCAVAPKGP